jgi:hypothetical protein
MRAPFLQGAPARTRAAYPEEMPCECAANYAKSLGFTNRAFETSPRDGQALCNRRTVAGMTF